MQRRRFLTAMGVGASVSGLAGCVDTDGDEVTDTTDDAETEDEDDDLIEDDNDEETDEPDDDIDDEPDADDPSDDEPDEDDPNDDPSDEDETDDEEDEDVHYDIEIEEIAELDHPWGLAFLPDDTRMLVTERDVGRLTLIDRNDGSLEEVDGTPSVSDEGTGGLLDITLHPDYPDVEWVYLTYAATDGSLESATHVGRAKLDIDARTLTDFEVLHIATPFYEAGGNYGSRVVFGEDDMLYVSLGDRYHRDFGPDHIAQDPSNTVGTTIRLEPDGSIPDDNPFVDDDDAHDAIYTYGHRNVQGMTVHPETGDIWQAEHGEQDGDEINVIQAGGNYGWPVTHYGCTYDTGEAIGELPHERDDIVDPAYYWECNSGGFPPSGMTFYDGDAFEGWQGDLFIGNLADRYLGHFSVDGDDVEELDPLIPDADARVRAVAVEPDTGHLIIMVDGPSPWGIVARLKPQ